MKPEANKKKTTMPVGSGDWLGRIVDIITSYTGQNPDEVTRETKLREMGMDSLDMVEILMDAEDEWNISISDEDAENLVTIGDAEKLIMQLRPNEKS
jgi:acyl carrier protein